MWYTVAQSRIERRRVCRLPKSRLSSETDRLVLKTVRIGSFRNVATEHERNVYWSADWLFSFSFLFFYYYLLLSSLSFSFFLFSIIFSFLRCLFLYLSYFLLLFLSSLSFLSLSFFMNFSFLHCLFLSLSFVFFNHYFLFSSREKMGSRKHCVYMNYTLVLS